MRLERSKWRAPDPPELVIFRQRIDTLLDPQPVRLRKHIQPIGSRVLVGHLPAGYLVSKLLARRIQARDLERQHFIAAGMLGAIAPDLDMFYFYFIDQRQHHHHLYFPHLPVVWLVLVGVSAAWLYSRRKAMASLALIFSLNGLVHMFLDSTAGDIWWFGPWVDKPFALVTVRARYQPWWLNFVLHWTFLLEVFVLLLAAYVWRRSRKTERGHAA
jgi:hypothetical protein